MIKFFKTKIKDFSFPDSNVLDTTYCYWLKSYIPAGDDLFLSIACQLIELENLPY